MTTKKELQNLATHLHYLAKWHGLYRKGAFKPYGEVNKLLQESYAEPHLILQEGEKQFGRPWSIHVTGGAYGTGHSQISEFNLNGYGVLGWTKKEAEAKLKELIASLEPESV